MRRASGVDRRQVWAAPAVVTGRIQDDLPPEKMPPEKKPSLRERTFEFVRGGGPDGAPWAVQENGDTASPANPDGPAAQTPGTSEIWHLLNGGGGWDDPIFIDFEEAQTNLPSPATAAGTRGVPQRAAPGRSEPGGDVSVYLEFREFSGIYLEHCPEAVFEIHAVLRRWHLNGGRSVQAQGVAFKSARPATCQIARAGPGSWA
jgi:manganese oxidase